MSEKTDEVIAKKIMKLLSWNSIKEFFIFLLLVSLAVIALGEAERRIADHQYYQMCLQQMKVCNGSPFMVACASNQSTLPLFNYSPSSPNSSLITSSSS